MKNQWIQWADRNDLECAYLVVTAEYINSRVINDEGDVEEYQALDESFYILGNVPNEYFDKIIDRAWEKLSCSYITYIEIKTESQICHDDKLKAMRDYDQRNAENDYLTVLETVQYYQNKDYQIFLYHNKFLEEIAARTSTASQPKQTQTNAPNQEQPRAVRSKRSRPQKTRAGADSSEYTHITFEIAKKVYEMLIEGKTQVAIAQELRFAERQFRYVTELKNIKKWIKEGKSEREIYLRNLHQYGMLEDDEFKDEMNDLQYGHWKL